MLDFRLIDYELFDVYAHHICQFSHSIWLDSSDKSHKNACYSFVMTDPLFKISSDLQDNLFEFLQHKLSLSSDNQKKISDILEKYPELPPFVGGFAGFLSYDYCVRQRFNLLNVPQKLNNIPEFFGGIYDVVMFANHQTQTAGIVALNINPDYTPSQRIDMILNLVQNKFNILKTQINIDVPYIEPNIYKDNVEKTKDYILKGDIFQANIAHYVQLKRPDNFDSFSVYRNLRKINPSPFGCYIHDETFQIMSASPERFLKIDNHKIIAEPIKGTINSLPDTINDAQQKNSLLNCPKNRAENVMIVDLLRNDITPFAKTGTIHTEKLCELQTFSGLHHLVSKITAQIQDNASVLDVLQYALPGGSITGAPKKRVCEIIYELEACQRGAYCGSAGYIGFNGNSDMNILIRTIQADTDSIIYHSGCGITAQSDAHQEWLETKTKAQKIIDSFKF